MTTKRKFLLLALVLGAFVMLEALSPNEPDAIATTAAPSSADAGAGTGGKRTSPAQSMNDLLREGWTSERRNR